MKYYVMMAVQLVFLNSTYSQEDFIGLFGNYYFEVTNGGAGSTIKKEKAISIIYNSKHLELSIQGYGTRRFPVANFRREIQNSSIVTSFVTDETPTSPYGHFWVKIDENISGINFQVIGKSVTYLVDKIAKYSENGKVIGRVSVSNGVDFEKKKKYYDSISTVEERKIEQLKVKKLLEDSLSLVKWKDSLSQLEEMKLASGNNYNNAKVDWISDTLQKYIKIGSNEAFYSTFTVRIDKTGTIIKLEPKEKSGVINEKYLNDISNIIVGRKIAPYIHKANQKNYPSYSTTYINLYHDPNRTEKKEDTKSEKKVRGILKNINY